VNKILAVQRQEGTLYTLAIGQVQNHPDRPWALIVCKVPDDLASKRGQNSTYAWHVEGRDDCSRVLAAVPLGEPLAVWAAFQNAVFATGAGSIAILGAKKGLRSCHTMHDAQPRFSLRNSKMAKDLSDNNKIHKLRCRSTSERVASRRSRSSRSSFSWRAFDGHLSTPRE
jgi:hypothetical protein